MGEHIVCEGGGERVSLDVEVAKHFIGSPSTKEANDISVNLCTEQGHGTARTEGLGRDVFWGEAEICW